MVITEEVDIKPVILASPSPPSNQENGVEGERCVGKSLGSHFTKTPSFRRTDMNEIDILMDELLKDVEVNVAAEPTVTQNLCHAKGASEISNKKHHRQLCRK